MIIKSKIERWMAHYTDVLITMNQEDYHLAPKIHLKKDKNGNYILIIEGS